MLNIDGNYQHIIWSHDELDYEQFVHKGLLNSLTLNPRVTIGLSDRINITLSQAIGVRYMRFDAQESIHHRTESTLTDFYKSDTNETLQARGGLFGDFKLKMKFLHKDTGMKEGWRIYSGLGAVVPSKSVLLADPFKSPVYTPTSLDINNDGIVDLSDDINNDGIIDFIDANVDINGDGLINSGDDLDGSGIVNDLDRWFTGDYDHRHFSLSNGVYKASFDFQIFKKLFSNPIFYGAVLSCDIPLKESENGFLPGINYSINSSMVFERSSYKQDEFNLLPGGFLYGLSYIGVEEASWDGTPTPNSRSMMLVPSIGGIWPLDKGSFSLSIQKPFFVKGRSIMVGIEDVSDDPLNNKTNVFEVVFGYRRNLGYMIPWL